MMQELGIGNIGREDCDVKVIESIVGQWQKYHPKDARILNERLLLLESVRSTISRANAWGMNDFC